MSKRSEITVVRLFQQLEALRVLLDVGIDDIAFMMKVTPLAYKNWKNHGAVRKALLEPRFRKAIKNLEKRHAESVRQS